MKKISLFAVFFVAGFLALGSETFAAFQDPYVTSHTVTTSGTRQVECSWNRTGQIRFCYRRGASQIWCGEGDTGSSYQSCSPALCTGGIGNVYAGVFRNSCDRNWYHCDNVGPPPRVTENVRTSSTRNVNKCHYISGVTKWSACTNGTQTAEEVSWATKNGSSCSHVPTTGVCGTCGSANGVSTITKPTDGLCTYGTASAVQDSNGNWTWTCNGTNGAQTQSCSAPNKCANGEDPLMYNGNPVCGCPEGTIECNGQCHPITITPGTAQLGEGGPSDSRISVSTACPRTLECVGINEDTGKEIFRDTVTSSDGTKTYTVLSEDITAHPTPVSVECKVDDDDDDDDDDDERVRVSTQIQCVCTAFRCTSGNTCQATPVFASSYDASQCVRECSSNADCSSGGIREVTP